MVREFRLIDLEVAEVIKRDKGADQRLFGV
jgi:hypothetical protein